MRDEFLEILVLIPRRRKEKKKPYTCKSVNMSRTQCYASDATTQELETNQMFFGNGKLLQGHVGEKNLHTCSTQ